MKTTNAALYALRLTYAQVPEITSANASSSPNRAVSRSAALMAVFGIALSSFSLKQMVSSPKVTTRNMKSRNSI